MNTDRGPLNEDVFSAPSLVEEKDQHPSIQELTEQIHRLLLQVSTLPARPPVPLCKWPGATQSPGVPIPPSQAPLIPSCSTLHPSAHGLGPAHLRLV